MKRILVDQDDVLADFSGEFVRLWTFAYAERHNFKLDEIKTFGIENNLPDHLKFLAELVYGRSHFFRDLPPVPGALTALREMLDLGYDVRICTAPLFKYDNCVREKYDWVDYHLGSEWTPRIVMTRDKTLVRGDYLIDDKPEITGSAIPEWQHVVFDRPHNQHVLGKPRIMSWDKWKDIIT